jgi:hypothetical protein
VVLVVLIAGLGCGQSDELVQNGVQQIVVCGDDRGSLVNNMMEVMPGDLIGTWAGKRKVTALLGPTIPSRERIICSLRGPYWYFRCQEN